MCWLSMLYVFVCHLNVSWPLEVELLEDRDQLLQLPVHEAVPDIAHMTVCKSHVKEIQASFI